MRGIGLDEGPPDRHDSRPAPSPRCLDYAQDDKAGAPREFFNFQFLRAADRDAYTSLAFRMVQSMWLRYGRRDSPVVTMSSFMIFSSVASV